MSRTRDEWRLEAHCCRACFGRIVSREADGDEDKRLYLCSNCGLEAEGVTPSALCACGTKIRKAGGKHVDAGLRCHENRARSPGFPSVITASFAGAQPDV